MVAALPAHALPAPALVAPAPGPRRVEIGRSVTGRPIIAREVGDGTRAVAVLVVGCVHGDECAGTAITRRLRGAVVPPGVDLWLVDSLNPDGAATGTRSNARGVDLNRNFPWGWHAAGAAHTGLSAGTKRLSEPEARAAYRLITAIRPDITIWYHQRLALVDLSAGDSRIQRAYADRVGLPVARLARYPGNASTWQARALPGTTAFVVELPGGAVRRGAARRHADAVLAAAGHALAGVTGAASPGP